METYEDAFSVCPACGYAEGSPAEEALHMEPSVILNERYIVGKVLGFGGFGVTYIGWDALLEQKVAIKEYLPSDFSTRMPGQTQVTVFRGDKQEQFYDGLTKFVEESQRLAKFHSTDGIVKIFDSFEANNTAYIIMEYLDGETLSEYVKERGPMSADAAAALLLPVIQSLRIVHEQGILHRDIAPDNIFITKDNQVKLIDFGASRYATTSHSKSLTVIIKPGYSAEEQYRSRGDQGSHTDVYSIGATLYWMITGHVPPDALERRAFFERKKKDVLNPISKYDKSIPANKETAILNALNVRIEDRTQSMDILAEELTSDEPVRRKHGKIKKLDVLKWPLWAKITFPAAVAAVSVLSILFSMGIIGFDSLLQRDIVVPDGMSRVPSVVNNTLADAEKRLNEAVLLYLIVDKEYSNAIPADFVLAQSIDPGSLTPNNSTVEIVISGGAETQTVPSIVGLNAEEAVKIAEDFGFTVNILEEYSPVSAAGSVISQDRNADEEFELGGAINIVISLGADPENIIEQYQTTVPNFVGTTYQSALAAAKSAGLQLKIKSNEYSGQYKKDVVMQQSVAANTAIMSGDVVELVVSLGTETVRVKDVQYKSETEATATLKAQNLNVRVAYDQNGNVASGIVLTQSPAAGTSVSSGAEVTIVVNKGETTFAMPNVAGKTETEARAALTEKGLSVTVNYEKSETVAEGNVIRQSVAANQSVKKGAAVTLTISSGKELETVPNVVGQSESAAKNLLNAQNFNVTVSEAYNATFDKGTVVSQAPAAGSKQTKGATVSLTISKGTEGISVPDVTGKSQSAAESTLKGLGFNVGISTVYSDTAATGVVISQTPGAGGTAAKGAAVSLTVSKGAEGVAVPNVTGNTQSAAESALRGLGFNVSVSGVYSDTAAEGVVLSQNPGAGGRATAGATIALTVSMGRETVSVPNLVGRSGNDAQSALSGLGLLANTSEQWSDTVAAGTVISQSVAAGDTVSKGTVVTIAISRGTSAWSDWTSQLPGGVGPSTHHIEEKTQYRYRDKSTTTSTSPDNAGWTLYDTKTEWGAWSGWSRDAVSSGSTRQVETQNVGATYATTYKYNKFVYWNAEYNNYYSSFTDNTGTGASGTWYYIEIDYQLPKTGFVYGGHPAYGPYGSDHTKNYWWNESTGQKQTGGGYTEYRYRDSVTTYYFYRWGEWSAWQDGAAAASDTREAEAQTLYRYRER
jgi:beta-lactam-binding protein with PASTA domain